MADRDPPEALLRIGFGSAVLAWPACCFVGGSRFDDPNSSFRVLYGASQRRGGFLESLARFRSPLSTVAETAQVPSSWLAQRHLARFSVASSIGPRAEIGSAPAIQAVRRALAPHWLRRGYEDFDLSHVVGAGRDLTQAIARWAYGQGYGGIRYPSRFDPALDLWAIFEGATFTDVTVSTFTPNHPDLMAVAALFRLSIAGS